MYAEIDFVLPEVAKRRLLGDVVPTGTAFRHWLARVADESKADLPPATFHFAAGRSLPTVAPLRFGSYMNGFRLTAVGEDGVELLREVACDVHRLLAKHTQVLVGLQTSEGRNRLASSPRPILYRVTTLAIGQRAQAKQWRALQAKAASPAEFLADPDVQHRLSTLLTRSLARQLWDLHRDDLDDVLGEDLYDVLAALSADPEDANAATRAIADATEHLMRRLRIRVVAAERFLSIPSGGTLNQAFSRATHQAEAGTLGLGDVDIQMHAELSGRWGLGLLQARGIGNVYRPRPDVAA